MFILGLSPKHLGLEINLKIPGWSFNIEEENIMIR